MPDASCAGLRSPLPWSAASLAMKILSVTERRPQDRIDAISLLLTNPRLDLDAVRADLALIEARGYSRSQDLTAKLHAVLEAVRES